MAISGLAIAGLVTSLAGTAASGIGSLLSNRRQQQNLLDDKAKSDAYYMRQLSQDPTKRSENAAVLRQLDLKNKELQRTNEAKNTIMGATPEMSIAQKQTTANSYADALSNLASLASQRTDLLSKEQYQDNQRFQQQRDNLELARKQTYANIAANAANLGASALSAIDAGRGKTSKAGTTSTTNTAKATRNDNPYRTTGEITAGQQAILNSEAAQINPGNGDQPLAGTYKKTNYGSI